MSIDERKVGLEDPKMSGAVASTLSSGDVATKPESLRNLTEEEIAVLDRQLTRKMDLIILPVIGILYILNYIDRQNLSAAKVQGIMKDLHLTTQQFATCISILFVGYLPFQIPSNLIISRIKRPGMYICIAVMVWGSISALNACVRNYNDLVAIRACLGIAEAVFFPGAVYYLSAWYPRRQLGKRLGGLYIAQQFGNAFGGLFAAAVLKLEGKHGIHGWQWLFIIEGSATVGIGLIAAFFMPEYPYNAKILTPIQRDLAVWRIESESGAAEGNEDVSVLKSFGLALLDPKLIMLIFANMLMQCQGSIANFFPTIVQSLGYNSTLTLVLTAPPYIFAGFVYAGITWYSDRKNSAYKVMMVLISISIVMYIIVISTVNVGARYFAMMCLPFSSVGSQIILYKVINTHLARPISKRAAASALVNAIGGTSNIWMSYLYTGKPHFYKAFGTLFGCAFVLMSLLTFYRWWVLRENRRLDSGDPAQIALVMKGGVTQEQVDLGWRYEMF
ncbi:MFS general substrate transporter [Meredithblackwellia eburnea MCA 4105]